MTANDVIELHRAVGLDHPFRINCEEFAKITVGFREAFDIVGIGFLRCYWNKKFLSLCDHRQTSNAYWDNELYISHINTVDLINKPPHKAIKDGYTNKAFAKGITTGIEILKKAGGFKNIVLHFKHYFGYSEMYTFTINEDIEVFTERLKKNKKELNRYLREIKSKSRSMIKEAKKVAIPITAFNLKDASPNKNQISSSKQRLRRYYLDGKFENKYLSYPQIQCLAYLVQGCKYQEIADSIFLSRRTVETHINTIRFKLNCTNKQELIQKVKSDLGLMSVINDIVPVQNPADRILEYEKFADGFAALSDAIYFDPSCNSVKEEVDFIIKEAGIKDHQYESV